MDTQAPAAREMDAWLLELLACPLCEERPSVHLNEAKDALICANGKHSYPIRDGFPMMRPEDAILLDAKSDSSATGERND